MRERERERQRQRERDRETERKNEVAYPLFQMGIHSGPKNSMVMVVMIAKNNRAFTHTND